VSRKLIARKYRDARGEGNPELKRSESFRGSRKGPSPSWQETGVSKKKPERETKSAFRVVADRDDSTDFWPPHKIVLGRIRKILLNGAEQEKTQGSPFQGRVLNLH